MKKPAPMKRKTVNLIKFKSFNALLRTLRVCVSSYQISVQMYKFLNLDTVIRTEYIHANKHVTIRSYFSKPKTERGKKKKRGGGGGNCIARHRYSIYKFV